MIKLYMGGSPCTHWSIAQTKNRETEPSGLGWELFKNYLIGLEKYNPTYFLYENNKSMAPAIREQITKELGVEPILINSALVSAQNRQRLYWTNIPGVTQREDKGILLRDVLESGVVWNEKSYCLTTRCQGAIPENTIERRQHQMVAEPVSVFNVNPSGHGMNGAVMHVNGKSRTLTTNKGEGPKIIEPVRIVALEYQPLDGCNVVTNENGIRCSYADGTGTAQGYTVTLPDVKSPSVIAGHAHNMKVIEPCIVWRQNGLCGNGGVVGAKTGLYAVPCELDELVPFVQKKINAIVEKYGYLPEHFNPYNTSEICNKTPTLTASMGRQTSSASIFSILSSDGTQKPVYEVLNGLITIKDKQYPIKLADGYYIIRKLTVTECKRLQTVPDSYIFPVSDSQAYKMLGNGWTVDVIAHILSHAPGITTEPVEVLSMYDGMSCGHIAMDKLGANVVRYMATEIDKYAIQTTMANYPNTIQLGDAFQVRDEGWRPTHESD